MAVRPTPVWRILCRWQGMNSNGPPSRAPVSRGAPAARGRRFTFTSPVRWPAGEGWMAVADEALRAAHVAHCGAMTLKDRPHYRDVARFLSRRAEMLTQLIESLAVESRCEDHLRHMKEDEVLSELTESEERLSAKVRAMLASGGHRLQLVKLLEQECILSQASRTRIKLALLEEQVAGNHPGGANPGGTAAEDHTEPPPRG
jgi:BMFP domain-containing protein YqiC